MFEYWPHITGLFLLEAVVLCVFLPWIVSTKRDSTAALAWCLIVIFMPFLGALLFWVFGYNYVSRPIGRLRRQRTAFRADNPPRHRHGTRGHEADNPPTWAGLGEVACRVQAFPVSPGNAVALYHDTAEAFDGLLAAVAEAKRHAHLEFFILRNDATTRRLLDLLTDKARAGVEVRLLYDAGGCIHLKSATLRPLLDAGGKALAFLPLNPLRSRVQVNLRNHRKLAVVDGRVAFVGGMNVGDEYLGKSRFFGYWRDSFLRLEGPAAVGLQRVFAEDWHFSSGTILSGEDYFPAVPPAGPAVVQVVESGPDQTVKAIREVYFAAISSAQKRLWVASPYFVPDSGVLDALRLACYRGVQVRLLTIARPDHYLSYYASRYNYQAMLDAGVEIYQYTRGMLHAKVMTADGQWAMVGSANLDNRSLHLSFEAGCSLYTPELVAEVEAQFERDFADAARLDPAAFAARPLGARLLENGCRLFSPLL